MNTLPLVQLVQQYLQDVLAASMGPPRAWPNLSELPYFLQDAFLWYEVDLIGHPVVLAIEKGESKVTLRDVRSKLDRARASSGQPILYVTGALASYERRQLIEHKTPFIVPGNQLYLPDLGLDLREYFRQRRSAPEAMAPATQAVLITLLLHPELTAWRSSELASELGYTSMTLSRATRDLVEGGLITLRGQGQARHLSLLGSSADVWERAQPLLRSPIKRVTWAVSSPHLPANLGQAPLAGASALARYSMLAEPRSNAYAVGPAQWLMEGLVFLPEWNPEAFEWQAWTYQPPPFRDGRCVDPLSLTLSLRDERDERVQLALDELREVFPW